VASLTASTTGRLEEFEIVRSLWEYDGDMCERAPEGGKSVQGRMGIEYKRINYTTSRCANSKAVNRNPAPSMRRVKSRCDDDGLLAKCRAKKKLTSHILNFSGLDADWLSCRLPHFGLNSCPERARSAYHTFAQFNTPSDINGSSILGAWHPYRLFTSSSSMSSCTFVDTQPLPCF